YGIYLQQFHTTTGNVIAGNRIGTNTAGTAAVGNGSYGIDISVTGISGTRIGTNADGTSDALERNVIAGNAADGVLSFGQNGVIAGNYCGTDVTGTVALGGGTIVLDGGATGNVVGGTTAAARNLISGNTYGVEIDGTGTSNNTVSGN